MTEFTSKTGAKILVTPAPWKVAKELKRAIESEMSKSQLPADFKTDDLSAFFNVALKVDSSAEVDAALWPCLLRCTRNGQKITEDIFDDAEVRKDYYEIITACVKENFLPFVGDLFFMLSALGMAPQKEKPPADQKSA